MTSPRDLAPTSPRRSFRTTSPPAPSPIGGEVASDLAPRPRPATPQERMGTNHRGRLDLDPSGVPAIGKGRERVVSQRPSAIELLEKPDGFLTTSDLRDLGLPRGAIESIFRELPNVVVPGYRRPMIRVADFGAFIEANTYDGTRVR